MITRPLLKNRFHSGKVTLANFYLFSSQSISNYGLCLFNKISINSLLSIIYRLIFFVIFFSQADVGGAEFMVVYIR